MANDINPSSTAFILICTALVQLMTPGLAFFYGGLVKDTSVLTMMMQCFISMGVSSIFWFLFGFSLCFAETWGFVGNPWTYMALRDLNVKEALPEQEIPGALFMVYQGMFAVITPALMTGAFADRFRFKPYLFFIVLWLLLVYCPWCHWLWGGGFLARWGARDFAGGIVVHVTAGFGALASLFVVGRREIPENEKDHHKKPHNVPFVALGTALLWFGWFGFNPGIQTVATVFCSVYSMVVTYILLKAISLCMPLKPESLHVDLHEHHEEAYHSPTRTYHHNVHKKHGSEGSLETSSASESDLA